MINMEDKISAIIPTLQIKPKVLNKLLNILDEDPAVDEIIVINNADKPFKPDKKIKNLIIYNSDINLYVNPSWNLGIELMKNDYFLIINDDILCPRNFCSIIMKDGVLQKEDTGLLGLYYWQINNYDTQYDDINIPEFNEDIGIKYIPFKYCTGTGNWASAFLGHKKNYYKIPDAIQIIYGDNYLLKRNLDSNKKNYFMKNLICNHITSATSSLPFSILKCDNNDHEFAREFFGEKTLQAFNAEPSSSWDNQ